MPARTCVRDPLVPPACVWLPPSRLQGQSLRGIAFTFPVGCKPALRCFLFAHCNFLFWRGGDSKCGRLKRLVRRSTQRCVQAWMYERGSHRRVIVDVTPFGCNVVGGMGEGGSTRSVGFARLRHSLYMFLLHLPHNCVLTLAFERSSLVPVSVRFLSLAT